MKTLKKILNPLPALLLLSLALLPACSLYDEGPTVSLSSAEDRVAGTWVVTRATKTRGGESTDVTSDYNDDSFTFNEDGTASHYFTDGSTEITSNGHWYLLNEAETLRLTETWTFLGASSTETHDWSIQRLTQKEMIIESRESDEVTRLELNAL